MRLLRLQVRVGAHEPEGSVLELDLAGIDGVPRGLTLIYGGSGAGKTQLLTALCCTRPGHCVAALRRSGEPALYAKTEWLLGLDEPDRQASLVLCTPNAPEEFFPRDAVQRREQSFFDGLARGGGFVFLTFSALRWFSRTPFHLSSPGRTLSRYDVRKFEPLDDAGRHDLTREVKQILAYAAIGEVLAQRREVPNLDDAESPRHSTRALGLAVRNVVEGLVNLVDLHYLGIDPLTFEAQFRDVRGGIILFDALPAQAKHLVGLGALSVKTLWSAYPGLDPLRAAGVIAVDQVELHQEEPMIPEVIQRLRLLFPEVQWLMTTRRAELLAAVEVEEGVALRRQGEAGSLQVDSGISARVH